MPIDRPEEFFLLPECVPAFDLFMAVQTQWRVGPLGPTGLDYAGVRASPAFRTIPAREREAVFGDLVHIERGWLTEKARRTST